MKENAMSALILWIDERQVKLFHLKPNAINVEHFKCRNISPVVEPSAGTGRSKKTDDQLFYKQLIQKLEKNSPMKWLLMGPSSGPKLFLQYLNENRPDLSQRVIGVEKVDPMPDSELLSVGRIFLHHYYMIQGAN
jgi:stalled ribosome rescue protein Dom34